MGFGGFRLYKFMVGFRVGVLGFMGFRVWGLG